MDAPKLDFINSSTFDWWYFDAVSPDAKTQVSILAGTGDTKTYGFPFSLGSSTWAFVTAILPNGTIFEAPLIATQAEIEVAGDGSLGNFNGTRFSWSGKSDLSRYSVKFDNPAAGLVGTIEIKSVRQEDILRNNCCRILIVA